MPELIQSGKNGMIVEPTVDSLFDGIIHCLDRRSEMSFAMQREIARWNWRERSIHYFDLFRQLIDARSVGQRVEAMQSVIVGER
jgi:hypothetical protein